MDWLSVNRIHLDFGRGRVVFERSRQQSLTYYGISPSEGVSLVSAMKVKKLLKRSEEVYMVSLTMVGEDKEKELMIEDIHVVIEFTDVFKPLERVGRIGEARRGVNVSRTSRISQAASDGNPFP